MLVAPTHNWSDLTSPKEKDLTYFCLFLFLRQRVPKFRSVTLTSHVVMWNLRCSNFIRLWLRRDVDVQLRRCSLYPWSLPWPSSWPLRNEAPSGRSDSVFLQHSPMLFKVYLTAFIHRIILSTMFNNSRILPCLNSSTKSSLIKLRKGTILQFPSIPTWISPYYHINDQDKT